jgi:branched-chain amino acid transport system ATP-binding protein
MLSLREVHAGYGGTRVLHDVTLHVPPGSIVALLGANGAGKTTVLRVAAGLVRPTAGALMVDGTDVTGWAPNALVGKGVCHVPEGRGVFPSLTVRENLVVQAKRGEEEAGFEAAASVFPVLGRRLDQVAGTLSGGEQQMLALMRAYIQNPKTVLLDFLRRIAADGTSLLLVEQYVTKALELSDLVYLLHKGRIAFAGEPGELDGEDLFARYLGHAA